MQHTQPPPPTSRFKKSLRDTLRHILQKCRRQNPTDSVSTIGSGILRRDPSLSTIPHHSHASLFTEFESSSQHDAHSFVIPDRFETSSTTTGENRSRRSLMPKMSLSDFDFCYPPVHERILHQAVYGTVPSLFEEGASFRASLVTLTSCDGSSSTRTPSLRHSSSSLRIQRSSQSLRSSNSPPPLAPEPPSSSVQVPPFESALLSPPRTLQPRRSLLRKKSSIADAVTLRSQSVAMEEDAYIEPPSQRQRLHHMEADPVRQRLARPPRLPSILESSASLELDIPPTPPQLQSTTATPTTPHIVISPVSSKTSSVKSEPRNTLFSVEHFSAFCAIDIATPGRPVIATSKDLRYIFDLGEQFCLNNQGSDEVSMDMVAGWDSAGNPVTHLVLFSPLVIPSSGRSRFMLASLVDITSFLQDTSSLPELEAISEESSEEDLPTPTYKPRPESRSSPRTPRYALSAEDLLGGCFVSDGPKTPIDQYTNDDIWLNLATEERRQYSRPKRETVHRTPRSSASSTSSVDEALDSFMVKLRELYSDFFLLAKSPLDDNYYEICNVSPSVYASRDYVNGHLSKTAAADVATLSAKLVDDQPFSMAVRWGTHGQVKQLYCIPLFARSAITWVCFLVDPQLPSLWNSTPYEGMKTNGNETMDARARLRVNVQ